ncbi:hypothetical protein [Haloarchaeobius iranensis]|uniref:DUF8163 domain-containing protein n=1 Tax=Haloarchaeobius iranensis TaxID=996166 RepID=A0A1H0AEC3_9EURY|nr:hypothetical protein [Haloarchaeobius iranensis]SDN31757.1 hypothetical protein SAMN05192554_12649 [Haloarchaeobius iranensis]
MNTPPLVPTVALGVASLGFALAGPTGLLVGLGVLALSLVLPWPLPFALGQVGAAVVFTEPSLATPFLVVQGGLWFALLLSQAVTTERTGTHGLVVAAAVTGGLLAGIHYLAAGSLLGATGVVAVVIAAVLYGVHRYERVTAGLVTR